MLTFKKFLEMNDPLENLEKMMIIRKLIPELTNRDAETILDWFADAAGSYDDLPDDLAAKLVDSDFAQTDRSGKDISDLPDHLAAPIVRGKLQFMMHDMLHGMRLKMRLKEDSLEDLEWELLLRRRYGISQHDAEILLRWARRGGTDGTFYDMDPDAVDDVAEAHAHEIESDGVPMQLSKLADAVMRHNRIPYDMEPGFENI